MDLLGQEIQTILILGKKTWRSNQRKKGQTFSEKYTVLV